MSEKKIEEKQNGTDRAQKESTEINFCWCNDPLY